jgi:hypothetical protein
MRTTRNMFGSNTAIPTPEDTAISEVMNAGALMAFQEDKAILEKVHTGMAAMRTPNIDLGLDLGAKTFRQALRRKIDAE